MPGQWSSPLPYDSGLNPLGFTTKLAVLQAERSGSGFINISATVFAALDKAAKLVPVWTSASLCVK